MFVIKVDVVINLYCIVFFIVLTNSEYGHDIPQSQTAENL